MDHGSTIIAETPFPSAQATQCPYPLYSALRQGAPVHRIESGEYVISRYADISFVLKNSEIFSSRHCMFDDGWMRKASLQDLDDQSRPWGIVTSDGDVHRVKRMLAMEIFKPAKLRARIPQIEAYIDDLIDSVIERGECEFVSEIAKLLPAKVIMNMLGLPPSDLKRALEWAHYEGFGTRFASPKNQAAARDSVLDMSVYLKEIILKRVDDPGDDDLSQHILRHKEHYGRLDVPNLIAEGMNLFNGGIMTTAHLLASMMMLFLENPEQQAKARASQDNLKNAVEEALRMESPSQFSLRLVRQDTVVGGEPIARGSLVLVIWASGNRDPEVFEDPDTFNVERRNSRDHLAMGGGPHVCAGAPLGRLEALIAFEHIFARMKNIRFAAGKNDFANLDTVLFRGPQRLYIEFDKA
jgi:cytochrome P450